MADLTKISDAELTRLFIKYRDRATDAQFAAEKYMKELNRRYRDKYERKETPDADT